MWGEKLLESILKEKIKQGPIYNKDDVAEYWHKRGIYDGLEIAYHLVNDWLDENVKVIGTETPNDDDIKIEISPSTKNDLDEELIKRLKKYCFLTGEILNEMGE